MVQSTRSRVTSGTPETSSPRFLLRDKKIFFTCGRSLMETHVHHDLLAWMEVRRFCLYGTGIMILSETQDTSKANKRAWHPRGT